MAIKGVFKAIADQIAANKKQDREANLYRNLMRHEARIGGTVFGPIPAGRRREFFCLDKHTWVWHEEWTDQNGQHQVMTTRYDVRPSGVVKSQNGSHYQSLTENEAQNLLSATELYTKKVRQEIYNFA